MAIKKATPYLNFDGTAEKAIKLYESALGARVRRLSTRTGSSTPCCTSATPSS